MAKMGSLLREVEGVLLVQKNIIETPIVKHPTATQGLNRSPDSRNILVSPTTYNALQMKG